MSIERSRLVEEISEALMACVEDVFDVDAIADRVIDEMGFITFKTQRDDSGETIEPDFDVGRFWEIVASHWVKEA